MNKDYEIKIQHIYRTITSAIVIAIFFFIFHDIKIIETHKKEILCEALLEIPYSVYETQQSNINKILQDERTVSYKIINAPIDKFMPNALIKNTPPIVLAIKSLKESDFENCLKRITELSYSIIKHKLSAKTTIHEDSDATRIARIFIMLIVCVLLNFYSINSYNQCVQKLNFPDLCTYKHLLFTEAPYAITVFLISIFTMLLLCHTTKTVVATLTIYLICTQMILFFTAKK